LEDDGSALMTEVRIDRHQLANGLFYGCEGMRVGGRRRLKISPHLAYGASGIPGVIPENAVITAEIAVLDAVRLPPS
jgi:FKBP-type peptidyl-prolyl cis-trans isomerase